MRASPRFPLVCLGAALAMAGLAARTSAETLDQSALIDALQQGGLVIYMRHAATEADYADQVAAVIGDCATQRMLSAEGWQQARDIGGAFASLDIPVGDVLSSEYCRAWQTADLAFGRFMPTAALNFVPAEDYSVDDIAAMRANVLPILSAPVTAGNRVIVGHDDPFEAATGVYPEPQGVVFVLRPDGQGGADILGHILPDAWPGLAD